MRRFWSCAALELCIEACSGSAVPLGCTMRRFLLCSAIVLCVELVLGGIVPLGFIMRRFSDSMIRPVSVLRRFLVL